MEQASTRDMLQELTEQPLGARARAEHATRPMLSRLTSKMPLRPQVESAAANECAQYHPKYHPRGVGMTTNSGAHPASQDRAAHEPSPVSRSRPDGEHPLRVLSLFAGIGGFDLGLERTGGFKTVAFCEIDPFCRRVLAKHWPDARQYTDVRELTAWELIADGLAPIDVVCGGFPCQDISLAGKGAGLAGEQSGLWFEFARIIGELGPGYVVVENVSALLGRGLDRVLRDLAAIGYDAEWHCIPASYAGAHHLRDRVWIIAHPSSAGTRLAAYRSNRPRGKCAGALEPTLVSPGHGQSGSKGSPASGGEVSDADIVSLVGAAIARSERPAWDAEPTLGRVVDGVPHRVVEPELRALGNAVVPQIPELIGRAILAAIADTHPKGGDAKQAPFMSGGGADRQSPKLPSQPQTTD